MSNGSEIRVIKKLGEGSFAEVFMAKSTSTGELFAIKRLKKRYRTFEEVQHLPEIYALQALQGHPNIIELLNLSYDPSSGYVSMFFELMDCNVYELISERKQPFDEPTTLILTYQILKAIAFIHSKHMFHRDIKPENCMVNKNSMELKLCDFGSTRSVTSTQPYTEYVSTRWYRAPECILTSGLYGEKVDEWAVGCMLYEIMTTRPLFPGKNEIDQIGRIHNLIGTPSAALLDSFRRNPNTQIKFAFPSRRRQDLNRILPRASKETVYLMEALLTYDPADRVAACDALDLPAFDEIRFFEEEWRASDCSAPFPVFFLKNARSAVERPIIVHNDQNEQKHGVMVNLYQSPGAVVTHHKFENNQSLKPLFQTTKQKQPPKVGQSIPAVGQTMPKQPISLLESRLKAAQRIAEYKKKQMIKKPQPFHGNAYMFSGQKVLKGGFQNPRIDLVHPRLPKIII